MNRQTTPFERRAGVFEVCQDGTLFLDEIGDLQVDLQVKLLRAIQEHFFRPVGGNKERQFSGRLVFATNRNLAADIAAGRFREDLYYRIASHQIVVPPLRERDDDLWLLVDHFLYNVEDDKSILGDVQELLSEPHSPPVHGVAKFDVVTARTRDEALARLGDARTEHRAFDVVVLDLHLPRKEDDEDASLEEGRRTWTRLVRAALREMPNRRTGRGRRRRTRTTATPGLPRVSQHPRASQP